MSSCWPQATAVGNAESAASPQVESETSPQRLAFRLDLQKAQSFAGRRDVLDFLESIVHHGCNVLVRQPEPGFRKNFEKVWNARRARKGIKTQWYGKSVSIS